MNKSGYKQIDLFNESININESKSLVISKNPKRILSKNQQTFNRYIKKIEKLQIDLQQTEKMLEEKLAYYGMKIHPLEQETVNLLKQMVKQLYAFYKGKLLISKTDRRSLKEIISIQLGKITSMDQEPLDEELKKIFKAVEGISFEKAREEDFDLMKEEMAEMFADFGVDMNLNDLHSAMTVEEMQKKLQEMQEELFGNIANMENENESSKRKKTKKQIAKEMREIKVEEARKKNINGIYRQLAKVLHPDLEQDAGLKAEKELMMQELTEAYKNHDLHTLLRLELKWVQKEDSNPDKLTEEKLAIYNQVLKEQVHDMEESLYQLMEHPRFQPLQKFCSFVEDLKEIQPKKIEKELCEFNGSIKYSIDKLKGKNALQEIKQIVSALENGSHF